MEHLLDFENPWCQGLLKSNIEVLERDRRPLEPMRSLVSNSMVAESLCTEKTIRAWIHFRRFVPETNMYEHCLLLSLGTGLDGKFGRAHGGFNALLIDHVAGMCASAETNLDQPPATANLNMDYRAPINTPGLVLCRASMNSIDGRKIRVKATIEDETGKILAEGTVLYIAARPKKL